MGSLKPLDEGVKNRQTQIVQQFILLNYSSELVNKISLQNILTRKIFTSASQRSQQALALMIMSSSKMRDKV